MQEQLISLETAKLAKERGFNIECPTYRVHLPYSISNPLYHPTQSLLQKWLREVHGIHIYLKPTYRNSIVNGYCFGLFTEMKGESEIIRCSDYEEALEQGLQEALKMINS